MIDLQSMYMKETMRNVLSKIRKSLKHTQVACEDAVIRYKYLYFFKGRRAVLDELQRDKRHLAQTISKTIKGKLKGKQEETSQRTHGENSQK